MEKYKHFPSNKRNKAQKKNLYIKTNSYWEARFTSVLCFFVTFCPLFFPATVAVVYFVRGILLRLLFPRWKTARRVKKKSELKAKLHHLFLGLVWGRLGMHPKLLKTIWDGYCWAYCSRDGRMPMWRKSLNWIVVLSPYRKIVKWN